MVNITSVDLLSLAVSIPYAQQLESLTSLANNSIQFVAYNESFVTGILGPNVSSSLISHQPYQAFHEAGVYNKATNSIYMSSNWAGNLSNPINTTVLHLDDYSITSTRYPNVSEGNGGSVFYPPGTPANSSAGQLLLFCDEGDFNDYSKLTLVDPVTNDTRVLVNSFFGRNFSSLNDVEQHYETGDVWFTDARYGYWQYFDPLPSIPPQVYRFEPDTGVLQAVADGFVAPNGIEFSPDFKHLYVTDTGARQFSNENNMTYPATIYRYDITPDKKGLQNRRLFAYADRGIPDGIHTDTMGNVYSGCGDGINVWNPEGVLLGKMLTPITAANFAFIPDGMIILNEDRLFKVTLKAEGRTVKRDFGLY
ncbi:hypothetical protein H2203_007725 [Taxawa tesnikishii (nom. ined.)]|nr:hypothetical protein H2203_007725 [Dothideales sp. JES 119]